MPRRRSAARSFSVVRRWLGVVTGLVVLIGSLGLSALIGASASAAANPSHLGTNPGKTASKPVSVPVPALSTQKSTTTRLPNGLLHTTFYPGAVNYQAGDGSWKPIDNTLTVGADRLARNGGNSWSSALGADAAAGVTASQGGTSLSFQLEGASAAAATVKGTTSTYPNALPGVGLSYTATNVALKETLTLASASAPSSFTFDVSTSSGATLRANARGGIDVISSAGKVAYGLDAPTVADHTAKPRVKSQLDDRGKVTMVLSGSPGAYKITVAIDKAWLASPERSWPVVVDPTVDFGSSDAEGCDMASADPTTSYCDFEPLAAGYDSSWPSVYRSMLRFDDITTVIPQDAVVGDAYLGVYSYGDPGSASIVPDLHAITHSWTAAATWNTYDGTNAWPTSGAAGTTNGAGGDYETAAVDSYGENNWVPSGTWLYAHPGSVVQRWINGSLPNNGLLLMAANETSDNYESFASFVASDSSTWPDLTVDWGQRDNTSAAYSAQLDDHLQLSVDATSGNVLLASNLLNYTGVGVGLNATATWNSLEADGQHDIGLGWSNTVRDSVMYVNSSGAWVNIGPEHGFAFLKDISGNFVTPPGANATLADIGGGSYTLTFNKTQEVWTFNSISTGPNSANGYLVSQKDRDGNTISYTWNTGVTLPDGEPELDSVTDTQGRTLTVGSPSGDITGYTDSTGRSVGFTTDGSDRTYLITDANGKSTTLTYTGHLITKITTPAGNITTISYDGSNRAATITRVTNNTLLTGYQYSFAYNTTFTGSPALANTVMTDPNSHNTTFYNDTSDNIRKVLDANGNLRQATYNDNSDPMTLKDGLSQVTTLAYDTNHNLQSITAPTETGSSAGYKEQIGYNVAAQTGGTSIPGYQYLPSGTTDAENHSTAYTYTPRGQLATTTPPTGGGTITNHYQGDSGISCSAKPGELCSTVDARGNTTSYSYDASGNVSGITPPAPLGAETLTADSLGRTTKIVDGRSPAVTTTYGYDAMDRITYLRTDGSAATACTSTDAAAAKCLKYVYDDDGNLTSRLDVTGTTTFGYDTLNRPTSKTPPTSGTSSSVGYDGANNITSYTDGGGTTNYTYDPANQVASLAEPGGTCTGTHSLCTQFHYTAAGLRDTTTYPSGETVNVTYDNAGREIKMDAQRPATHAVILSHTYSYLTGTSPSMTDHDLLQTDTPASGSATSYGYDNLGRLTSATTGANVSSYSYDAAGNLTQSVIGGTTTHYGYNNANEWCWWGATAGSNGTTSCPTTPTGDGSVTHNGDGDEATATTSAGPLQSQTWNALDQMASSTTSGATTTFSYADVGQAERVSATTGGTTTTFTNGLELGLTAQKVGTATTRFVRDPYGNLIGMLTSGGSHEYYITDRLGSVLALSNSAGTAEDATYSYDPYGNTTASGTVSVTNPFRYISGYQDASLRYHLGQREYNYSVAAFSQQDSISHINSPTNANRYVYAGDNPTNYTDPSGLCGGFLGVNCLEQATSNTVGALGDAASATGNFLSENKGCIAASVGVAGGVITFGGAAAASVGLAPETFGLSLFGGVLAGATTVASFVGAADAC